ncbi:hypothetical protein J6590_097933 [Homalodisca vitripennis]|nr:hypothetical protein J6590_097933 [Homalodisca vitripennis]
MGSRREDAPSPNLTHPENPTTLEACSKFGHSVEAIAFPQCSPGIYTDNGRLHVEITWTMALFND